MSRRSFSYDNLYKLATQKCSPFFPGGAISTLYGDSQNFDFCNFPSRGSTYKIGSGGWVVYTEPNYQGKYVVHLPGKAKSGYVTLSPECLCLHGYENISLYPCLSQVSVSAMTQWWLARLSTSPGPALLDQLGPSAAWATGPSSAAWSRSGTKPCSGWSESSWRVSSTATTLTTPAPRPGSQHGR